MQALLHSLALAWFYPIIVIPWALAVAIGFAVKRWRAT